MYNLSELPVRAYSGDVSAKILQSMIPTSIPSLRYSNRDGYLTPVTIPFYLGFWVRKAHWPVGTRLRKPRFKIAQ